MLTTSAASFRQPCAPRTERARFAGIGAAPRTTSTDPPAQHGDQVVAADPELKQLAVQIKAAQDPEIVTTTGWLTTWGQPTMMPSGHDMGGRPGMMSEADMAKLSAATGKDFDKQFMQMMIDHHKGATAMAKDEQAKGSNPDAKALAGRIIGSQQADYIGCVVVGLMPFSGSSCRDGRSGRRSCG